MSLNSLNRQTEPISLAGEILSDVLRTDRQTQPDRQLLRDESFAASIWLDAHAGYAYLPLVAGRLE